MNIQKLPCYLFFIIIILVQSYNASAICNCSFIVDEVVPCSSLCSSDGSITIISNEGFCNSLIRWGLILDGDTLEDYSSSSTGCSHCIYTFSNLSPGTYTIYRITYGSPSCLAEETVGVGGLPVPCQSPYSISVEPGSVPLCSDGNITLTNQSDCFWESYLFDSDSNLYLGPFANFYNNGIISIRDILGNGLQPGTYYIRSTSNLPTINGSTVVCDIWDTIVVNASCYIHATVSPGTCANSHCNCSFKVSALTNGCAGFYSEIIPLGGYPSNPEYALSGDTIIFDNLYPQTYVVHTYPFSFGITPLLCEQFDTVVVQDSPCTSPYSISVQQPSSFSCYNGNITLTNISDCYWLSYLYRNDTTNAIIGPWDNVSNGGIISLSNYSGGFNNGTYYIRSQVYNLNYFGQQTFCNVWDTIVLNGPCNFTTNVVSDGCAGTNCDCSIHITETINECNNYFVSQLYNINGFFIGSNAAGNGETITFENLYPGTYVVRSFPSLNGAAVNCYRYDTIVILNGPCISPYAFSVQQPSGFNCFDGNITLTNHSPCFWLSSLYKNDTNTLIVNGFANNTFDGIIPINYFTGGLSPGTYYIHSYVYIPYNNGQYVNCDVWDTIVLNGNCNIATTVIATGCSGSYCDCTIKVYADYNGCFSYQSFLNLIDGTAVGWNAAVKGDSITFPGLYPGTYVIRTKPYFINSPAGSEQFDTIVIQNSPCVSPYTFTVEQPGALGCYDGNIILTNHSSCFWLSYLYKNDTNQLLYGPIPNNLLDGIIPINQFAGGLSEGTYYLHSFIFIPFNNGQYTTCDLWDTIQIGVSCQLNGIVTSRVQPVFLSCNNGSFTMMFTHDDCRGLIVNLRNPADNSIIATSELVAGIHTAQFIGLNSGNYIVEAIQASDPSCTWEGTVTLTCQSPTLTVHLKVLMEGFYRGNGLMQAVANPAADPNLCDTVTVELHDGVFPYNLVESITGTVNIRGEGSLVFYGGATGNNNYIAIKQRNTLETWSANPVLLANNILYDFTDSRNKAYGNNLSDLGGGRFALYSGDVNRDGIIDANDFSDMESNLQIFSSGYIPDDLTGDGLVESADYSLMENNLDKILLRP